MVYSHHGRPHQPALHRKPIPYAILSKQWTDLLATPALPGILTYMWNRLPEGNRASALAQALPRHPRWAQDTLLQMEMDPNDQHWDAIALAAMTSNAPEHMTADILQRVGPYVVARLIAAVCTHQPTKGALRTGVTQQHLDTLIDRYDPQTERESQWLAPRALARSGRSVDLERLLARHAIPPAKLYEDAMQYWSGRTDKYNSEQAGVCAVLEVINTHAQPEDIETAWLWVADGMWPRNEHIQPTRHKMEVYLDSLFAHLPPEAQVRLSAEHPHLQHIPCVQAAAIRSELPTNQAQKPVLKM